MCLLVAMAACGGTSAPAGFETSSATSTTTTASTVATTLPTTTRATPRRGEVIEVAYRIEVHTADPAGATFPSVVESTIGHPRGWQRADFRILRSDDAEYRVILAEPAEAQELCKPYDVYSKYSCQNGPLVVINAERWRDATPEWTGDLATYREMVVNHEFGHLLGQHHPKNHCPVPGGPAAIMSQQSTELNGCLPNPWPLDSEIELAARHDEPLAPPYSRS
ncbi:MAG: hypothetical protein QOG87_1632 [Actinomycetota bacterium]|jgi:hypothetical protein